MHLGGPGAERVVLTRQDWRPDNRDGWGGNGSWYVKFADDAAWSARVHLQAGAQAQRVRLAWIGTDREAVYESEVPAGAREVVIALPKAPRSDATVRLQAKLVGGKRDGQGPHQVVLER